MWGLLFQPLIFRAEVAANTLILFTVFKNKTKPIIKNWEKSLEKPAYLASFANWEDLTKPSLSMFLYASGSLESGGDPPPFQAGPTVSCSP